VRLPPAHRSFAVVPAGGRDHPDTRGTASPSAFPSMARCWTNCRLGASRPGAVPGGARTSADAGLVVVHPRRSHLLASGASSLQCARLQVPMERLGLSAVARFLEDGMLLLVCSRSALEGASAGTVMCEANGERWRGLNECALKERCGDRHARGEVWGMRIMNFATGSLEVHKDATHLMVGPSHRTDRPALASQDEISSQEGRAGAVRPSCVVSVRGEAMSRWRSSLESALHLRILRHRQNFFPRAEQELVRCISQLLTKLRTGRPAH
jgi:hypothetical protein